MNKKVILTICAVVIIAIIIVAAYLLYSAGDYSLYSNAFKKTFNVDSMELNTSVQASIDGSNISSTGNFKLKGMNSTPQFINTMTIGGQTITQFSDGEKVYTDDGTNKNKMQMGENPQPRQEKENTGFSYDAYISEFSNLIDASKIKELNSLEPVAEKYVDKISKKDTDAGKQFDITLLPQAVDELVSKFLSENLSSQNSPTVSVNSITYSATVSDGYVAKIVFKLDLNVTAPGETEAKKAIIDFTITPVNPGKAVSFDLPSTDSF